MAEEKKKRIKGFAKVVAKEVEVLNTIEQFKEDFKDSELKVLLNPKDGRYAALIVVDKGKIYVESIENTPKENIKKKNAGWEGLIGAKMQFFLDLLGGGDVSMGSVIWKILTFRIKIKGIKNVLTLLKLFEYE